MPKHSIWQLPLVQALLIQVAVFLVLSGLFFVFDYFFQIAVTLGIAILLQAFLAACLSYLLRLPKWWLFIQFFFPICLFAALALEIPPVYFLSGFLVLFAIFGGIVRTRVPLFLSPRPVWVKLLDLLPEGEPVRFIDIGSGLGGLLIYLEKQRPDIRYAGVELSLLPWVISKVRAKLAGSQIDLRFGDYESVSFSDFDVAFAFLSPVVMEGVWDKVAAEMSHGSLFLSLAFPIPHKKPDFVIQAERERAVIYGYHVTGVA